MDDIDAATDFYPSSFTHDLLGTSILKHYRKHEGSRVFIVRKAMNFSFDVLGALRLYGIRHGVALKLKYFEPKQDGERTPFGGELRYDLTAKAVAFLDNVPRFKKGILKRHVRVVEGLSARIDEFALDYQMAYSCVGLHIRNTDKKPIGSTGRLIKKLDSFVEKMGIQRIFLSTDNEGIEAQLREHYGDMLITYPKMFAENEEPLHYWVGKKADAEITSRMAEEAVIDMFLLSKCEYLLS